MLIVAALFVLMARQGNAGLAPIGLFPILAFWSLDGYFLWQERLFRALYEHVRAQDTDSHRLLDECGKPFPKGWKRSWFGAMLSRTLVYVPRRLTRPPSAHLYYSATSAG